MFTSESDTSAGKQQMASFTPDILSRNTNSRMIAVGRRGSIIEVEKALLSLHPHLTFLS